MHLGANTPNSTPLIPLTNHDGITAVMGRDLHEFLEVGRDYTNWFKQMTTYGFRENAEWVYAKNGENLPQGGRPRTDHILTLDMAKQIAMIQRTDKGRQAREYFLECERIAKENTTPAIPQTYAEALRAAADAAERAAALEAKTREDAPKVEYHDTFVADEDLIQFRTLANQLNIGERYMRDQLEQHGWIYNDRTKRWSNQQARVVWESRWRAAAGKKHYFRLVAHHKAPRINGEVRQTLKITPAGAVAIRRALAKWGCLDTNTETEQLEIV